MSHRPPLSPLSVSMLDNVSSHVSVLDTSAISSGGGGSGRSNRRRRTLDLRADLLRRSLPLTEDGLIVSEVVERAHQVLDTYSLDETLERTSVTGTWDVTSASSETVDVTNALSVISVPSSSVCSAASLLATPTQPPDKSPSSAENNNNNSVSEKTVDGVGAVAALSIMDPSGMWPVSSDDSDTDTERAIDSPVISQSSIGLKHSGDGVDGEDLELTVVAEKETPASAITPQTPRTRSSHAAELLQRSRLRSGGTRQDSPGAPSSPAAGVSPVRVLAKSPGGRERVTPRRASRRSVANASIINTSGVANTSLLKSSGVANTSQLNTSDVVASDAIVCSSSDRQARGVSEGESATTAESGTDKLTTPRVARNATQTRSGGSRLAVDWSVQSPTATPTARKRQASGSLSGSGVQDGQTTPVSTAGSSSSDRNTTGTPPTTNKAGRAGTSPTHNKTTRSGTSLTSNRTGRTSLTPNKADRIGTSLTPNKADRIGTSLTSTRTPSQSVSLKSATFRENSSRCSLFSQASGVADSSARDSPKIRRSTGFSRQHPALSSSLDAQLAPSSSDLSADKFSTDISTMSRISLRLVDSALPSPSRKSKRLRVLSGEDDPVVSLSDKPYPVSGDTGSSAAANSVGSPVRKAPSLTGASEARSTSVAQSPSAVMSTSPARSPSRVRSTSLARNISGVRSPSVAPSPSATKSPSVVRSPSAVRSHSVAGSTSPAALAVETDGAANQSRGSEWSVSPVLTSGDGNMNLSTNINNHSSTNKISCVSTPLSSSRGGSILALSSAGRKRPGRLSLAADDDEDDDMPVLKQNLFTTVAGTDSTFLPPVESTRISLAEHRVPLARGRRSIFPTTAHVSQHHDSSALSDEFPRHSVSAREQEELSSPRSISGRVREESYASHPSVSGKVREKSTSQHSVAGSVRDESFSSRPSISGRVQEKSSSRHSASSRVQDKSSSRRSVSGRVQDKSSSRPSVSRRVREESSSRPSVSSRVREESSDPNTVNRRAVVDEYLNRRSNIPLEYEHLIDSVERLLAEEEEEEEEAPSTSRPHHQQSRDLPQARSGVVPRRGGGARPALSLLPRSTPALFRRGLVREARRCRLTFRRAALLEVDRAVHQLDQELSRRLQLLTGGARAPLHDHVLQLARQVVPGCSSQLLRREAVRWLPLDEQRELIQTASCYGIYPELDPLRM